MSLRVMTHTGIPGARAGGWIIAVDMQPELGTWPATHDTAKSKADIAAGPGDNRAVQARCLTCMLVKTTDFRSGGSIAYRHTEGAKMSLETRWLLPNSSSPDA
ncbi:hypothetical protein ACKU27_13950 [Sphingobium yanoikuyae]